MMKNVFALALIGLGVVASTGCAAEQPTEAIGTTEAYLTSSSCFSNYGVNPMKAALAVAMSDEMGRIDALKDLKWDGSTWSRVGIAQDGLDRCAARNLAGCPETQAILDLQKDDVNRYLSQQEFNATNFREDLRSSFERQRNHESDLTRNNPSRLPQEHSLTRIGTFSNAGACGIHYDFAAAGNKIENIKERLVFFGGNDNPFLAFQSTTTTVAIDPTGTMNGDTTGSTSTLLAVCTSTTLSLKGKACTCSGKTGTLQPAPWNSRTLYCAN